MRLIRGLHNLKKIHRGCVATIGNFDGVHLGHQAMFRQLRREADSHELPLTVIIFEPQPMEYFRPAEAPPRLTSLREKVRIFAGLGIDNVLILHFSKRLAAMGAETFIDEILVRGLGVRHLFVGDDFRFGRARSGDVRMLREAGEAQGFTVDNMDTLTHRDERISSTRIRRHLIEGDLEEANTCLGRSYAICGRVAHGDKRGRTIGFPTLNVVLRRKSSPLRGVFAVRAGGLGDKLLPGVANIGNRPTVEGDDRFILEVHLFDFDREVYGQLVEVDFVARIRDEMKFDSFDALRRQILEDADKARRLLGVNPEQSS
jgi:riboflavin kinase / FMN adenylyltransferase